MGFKKTSLDARAYLRSIMPTHKQVEDFIADSETPENLSRSFGYTFDVDLGWVQCDAIRANSIDGSKGFYHYESDGARKVINFHDKPCRIHTYGNSFTHCDQVSDGETWQEYLAAHLQEPIRNYGVGGHSVYQAYRRMLKVEKENPAEYIILNIYDDDHFRNLDSWRMVRFGRSACGWPLPHLRVNIAQNRCQQMDNPLRCQKDVFKLCEEEFVWQTFKDDPVLKMILDASSQDKITKDLTNPAAVTFGIPKERTAGTRKSQQIQKVHLEASLYATKNVITWTEQFVKKTGKKLMIILSFGRDHIADELNDKPRFDQSFVDWLKDKPYPVIDMRDVFKRDYQRYKIDVETYLDYYYIGHHTPAGNFFIAWAIKDKIVEWLDPKPLSYR